MIPNRVEGSLTPLAPRDPIPTLLRDLVQDRTGIFFEDDRIESMLEKLEARAKDLKCRSFLDYYYILKYDEKNTDEWRRVMDAFSVQETYFWREFDQIRVLVDHLIPAWFRSSQEPFRIWSSACATGEEPYTIAMAIAEAGLAHLPIKIYGSDASESALTKARAAVYRERSFRVLSAELRAKYFSPDTEGSVLKDEIRERVNFDWANLVALGELGVTQANVIFCRNVFIYFSQPTIKQVLKAFADRLPAQGTLFVGASESLLKLTQQFELRDEHGAFAYVRVAGN